VVVNAKCEATREHCERSGGGLWYGRYREFEVIVDTLLDDAGVRGMLAARGRAYVDREFRWGSLIDRYAAFLRRCAARAA
jgi:glycosyltransferase involved in cell wall biosynthesis